MSEEQKALTQNKESSSRENPLKSSENGVGTMETVKVDQDKHKSLLVLNESNDADIILYIYSGWSPFCATSTLSKIIQPKQKYLYREKTSFKFQLVANFKNKRERNDMQMDCEEKGEKHKQNVDEKRKENEKENENKRQKASEEQEENEKQCENKDQKKNDERKKNERQNKKKEEQKENEEIMESNEQKKDKEREESKGQKESEDRKKNEEQIGNEEQKENEKQKEKNERKENDEQKEIEKQKESEEQNRNKERRENEKQNKNEERIENQEGKENEERKENKEKKKNKEQNEGGKKEEIDDPNRNEGRKENNKQNKKREKEECDEQNRNEKQNESNKQNEKQKENEGQKEKPKQKKKNLLGPQRLYDDKLIRITESLDCRQESLADFPNEKRVCLRKINREKELATGAGQLNLYEILGLDMEEIRKMEKNDAMKAIKKAFNNQIRIWHPDKNFGDGEIAMQIIFAKEILLDDARRARYHNGVDYDTGWFSLKRWKSIFWPECCSKEQNTAFWRRIFMSGASLGLAVGGGVLSACTAGTATPVVAMCAAIFAAGCTVGGGQSLMYTVSKESIVDGCEAKKWAQETAKGFTIGGITGGFAAAYTATTAAAEVAANLGEEAVECTYEVVKVGVKRIAGNVIKAMPGKMMGAATKTTKDFIYERLNDSVENQPPLDHVKRCAKNLISDVVISAVSKEFDTAKKLIKGEMREDCCKIRNEGKKAGCLSQISEGEADGISQEVFESGAGTILEGMTEFMENCLGEPEHGVDRDKENEKPRELKVKEKNVEELHQDTVSQDIEDEVGSNKEQIEPEKTLKSYCPINVSRNQTECDTLHAVNEENGERSDKQTEPAKSANFGEVGGKERLNPNKIKTLVPSEKSEIGEGGKLNEGKINEELTENTLVFVEDHFGDSETTFFTYQPSCRNEQAGNHVHSTKVEESLELRTQIDRLNVFIDDQHKQCVITEEAIATETSNDESFPEYQETNNQVDEEETGGEFLHGIIKYRSKGDWFSRMNVAFTSDGESCEKIVSGDGTRVYIPANATNIEVRFQVSRPHWGFIQKYDRFNKTWCQPYEPHVFRYDRPPIRTFTISGNLWWEAVMRVSDEYHEETKEMS